MDRKKARKEGRARKMFVINAVYSGKREREIV
jgi:hypothetical protein